MEEGIALQGLGDPRFQIGQPVETVPKPGSEVALPVAPFLAKGPPTRLGEGVGGARGGPRRQRGGSEAFAEAREGVEDAVELAQVPGLLRVLPLDVLEGEGDPAVLTLVVRPEQARRGDVRGHARDDAELAPVDARALGVEVGAHCLHEEAPAVGEAQSHGHARREAGGLRHGLANGASRPRLEGFPQASGGLLPVEARTLGRGRLDGGHRDPPRARPPRYWAT